MEDIQTVGQQHNRWKTSIPFLYDWITAHNLHWPTITCRWTPTTEDSTYKRTQHVYLSERTGTEVKSKDPNRLVLVPIQVVKPRVAAAETIQGFDASTASTFVQSPIKTIIHPGEVNKIREIPQQPSVVATHSDEKHVFIWHFDRQPNRTETKHAEASVPDLLLVGHEEEAQFALSTSSQAPFVASGGQDNNVLLWDLRDYDGGSLLSQRLAVSSDSRKDAPTLKPKFKLQGHTATVEDVAFKPQSSEEVVSVGDDFAVHFWDTRSGTGPAASVAKAHEEEDVTCVDWSQQDPNLIATGAHDGSLKIWDRRKLETATHTFRFHSKQLLRLEWANYRPGILASGGEDGIVCVWDLNAASNRTADSTPDAPKPRGAAPTELIFQHAGHRSQVGDFQWHPTDPFTMMSVSDDGTGGTLQVWRIIDFIYRPEAEVIAELEQIRAEKLAKHKPKAARKQATPPVQPNPATAPVTAEPAPENGASASAQTAPPLQNASTSAAPVPAAAAPLDNPPA